MEDIRIVRCRVGRPPEITHIPNDLHAMQREVGGMIEAVPLMSGYRLVCDEEGKLKGKPINLYLNHEDFIAGDFFWTKVKDEDFVSLSAAEACNIASIMTHGGKIT